MSEQAPAAVELKGITKRFPGVVANKDVQLRVAPGTVHAVMGENGAGKSTLMKILYGMQQPDEGVIEVEGRPVTFHSPSDAIAAGIGMVHQHFKLADNFTVLENVVLGAEPGGAIRLDIAAARARILEISDRYGLDVDPDPLVADLGVGAAAADRDPQGALPRRTDPHPRRADRGPGAAGGRRAVRGPGRAQGRGPDHHLHLAQARRGAQGRRRDHRAPRGAPPSPLCCLATPRRASSPS